MEWQTILGLIVSWIFLAGLNYGLVKGELRNVKERVSKLEDEKFITRNEYEARHRELMELLKHIRN